ncbi:MAG TPA: cell division protein FtsA [Candidatus Polarisedimenticolia bacterium]|nr:cell division protein FtsA [Candidatus Polarisedimenticolia bacterium]
MTKKDRHFVALDIGSTKTCALIGEQDDDGGVKFAALGAAESKGWRKGQIVNLDLAVSSIRRAVEEAEAIVGVPVESATIGVAGSHVRGVNSRGGITVGAKPRDIHREDVRRAIEAARGVTLPEDREVLHVLPQEFFLDAQDNIRDAIGMVGQRLEANVHIVTASGTATQNIVTAVNRAGVRVDDTVLEPLASAESCLTQDERELGACLLDIGGGTTELIAYAGGVVRETAAIPVGGDHFTNDLAVGLRTPIPEAEKIKREHACTSWEPAMRDTAIEIASVGDRPPRTVFVRSLSEIVEPRAQELLMLIRDELRRGGLESQIPAGIVLTGGGARLRGLPELAERLFNLPVRVAVPRGLAEMSEEVSQPEYSTAVGLVLYGARTRRLAGARPAGFVGKLKSMFAGA